MKASSKSVDELLRENEDLCRRLEEAGYLTRDGQRLELTPAPGGGMTQFPPARDPGLGCAA